MIKSVRIGPPNLENEQMLETKIVGNKNLKKSKW
jgi:hypothetical protein